MDRGQSLSPWHCDFVESPNMMKCWDMQIKRGSSGINVTKNSSPAWAYFLERAPKMVEVSVFS